MEEGTNDFIRGTRKLARSTNVLCQVFLFSDNGGEGSEMDPLKTSYQKTSASNDNVSHSTRNAVKNNSN